MFSLVILVMAGCENISPAPAETVVDISKLPTLHTAGTELEVNECSPTQYRWKDCVTDQLHTGMKLVRDEEVTFTTQGEKFDLLKHLGLSEGKELVVREVVEPEKSKDVPSPTRLQTPTPVSELAQVKDDDSTSWLSDIPWHWLGYILLAGIAALLPSSLFLD